MIRTHAALRQALVPALGGGAAAALIACTAGASAVTGPHRAGPSAVVVHDGAGSHTVTVKAGQRLEVVLDSTYWNVAGSSRPGVLRQDGESAVLARPASCPTLPGMGCTPIQTDFSALKPGVAVVTASRTSCGEALECAPGQRNFTLKVTVRAAK
jgi:hypothetical protein